LTFSEVYDTLFEMRKLLAILTVATMLPLLILEASAPKTDAKAKYSKAWYGMASWYGEQWRGKKTACGQRYDPDRLVAAHPYLPCGTWVRVTNVRTGHSEFARVIDRGPYEEGREMDVSERVADRIDLKKYGVEKVKIEIVREVK
jgi:rare lipoprotein A